MKRTLGLVASLAAAALALAACGPSTGKIHDNENLVPDMARPGPGNPDYDGDGDGYTPRAGDCNDKDPTIHPTAPEICLDHIDQDCNGVSDEQCDDDADGYAIWDAPKLMLPGGDCNDVDPNISPGAYEVTTNGRDDNCNMIVDEPTPSCDTKLFPTDPTQFAASMEVCKPWIQAAQWNAQGAKEGRTILGKFGYVVVPQASESMVMMSSGTAYTDVKDARYVSPRPGQRFQNQEANPLQITSKNICTGGNQLAVGTANDLALLTLTIKAPTNAKAFRFQFYFYSAEYSDFVGAQYNDMFIVNMTSKKTNGNIVYDTNNQPITVNSGFFAVCLPQPICQNGGHNCVKGPGELAGTGYDEYIVGRMGQQVGGATGWLTTTAPITPGETFTLQFFVFDAADHDYDSAVLIDNFQWLFDETVTQPSTG